MWAGFPAAASVVHGLLDLGEPQFGHLVDPGVGGDLGPEVRGGQYYGPDGWGEIRGYPRPVRSSDLSHDAAVQRRLWDVSQELTDVTLPV